TSGAFSPFKPLSPGLIEPQPVAFAVQGVMNSPQNFLHEAAKTFAFCPGQMRQAVASMPSRRRFSNG
ncbi:hypothetical protein ZM95_26680, partial [Salmonella enterica]|nr:hypothetical protein [Salmonella enterica]